MVNVKFYGSLRQFGTSFKIDAENTAEIIRALTSQIPKLREFIQKSYFTVRIAKEYIDNRYLEKGLFYKLKEGMTVHFTPVLKGSKRGGVFQTILGAALVGAAFLLGPVGFGLLSANSAWVVGGLGASLMLGGVAQLLTPQPKMPAINEKEKKQSTSFSNLSNMAAQGRMVPLAYGRIRCGSLVISQGVQTLDVNIVEKNQNTGFSKG